MGDEPRPQSFDEPPSSATIGERLAVVESNQRHIGQELREMREQRDREHRENTTLLRGIGTDLHDLLGQMADVKSRVGRNEEDITGINTWRKGLSDEIRGALRFPRLILAITPVASAVIAIVAVLQSNVPHP